MEPNTPNNETPEVEITPPSANWTKRLTIGAIAIAALGGIGLATAMSSDSGFLGGPGMWHHAGGPGMGFSGRHGMGFGERRLDRVLDEIDATDEQETKIKAIIEKAGDELFPMADEFRGTREQVADLLGAATIDRAAAETLRAERVAKVDEASRKLTTAVLDIAEVLTPEQRAEIVDHFKDRGRRW